MMRCLLVLCALVALASAASIGESSYIPEGEYVNAEVPAAKPKEHPTNNYQFKYGLADIEKELLLTLNSGGDSDDLNKAFFEYTNSRDQVYRTDYISDAAHKEHVL